MITDAYALIILMIKFLIVLNIWDVTIFFHTTSDEDDFYMKIIKYCFVTPMRVAGQHSTLEKSYFSIQLQMKMIFI
jgi:hypothetical protein